MNNIANMLMLPTSNAVKDLALNTVQHMSNDVGDAVLIDMDSVGDKMPQDDEPATKDLRELIEQAHNKDAQFLYIY